MNRRRHGWRIAVLGAGAVVVMAADVRAQTVTDERVWFTLTMQDRGERASPWHWSMETIARSRNGLNELDLYSLRPTVSFALTTHSMVGGGYAFVSGFPVSGGTLIEHRPFGVYSWSGRVAGGTLLLRTRLEARYVESNSGPVGRLRQQVRFTHPIRPGSRWSYGVGDELFVHLNQTRLSVRGVEQNRAFVGLSIVLNRSLRTEIGYVNQFGPGHGRAARMNHVVSANMICLF